VSLFFLARIQPSFLNNVSTDDMENTRHSIKDDSLMRKSSFKRMMRLFQKSKKRKGFYLKEAIIQRCVIFNVNSKSKVSFRGLCCSLKRFCDSFLNRSRLKPNIYV
jgi:hypothetical protein